MILYRKKQSILMVACIAFLINCAACSDDSATTFSPSEVKGRIHYPTEYQKERWRAWLASLEEAPYIYTPKDRIDFSLQSEVSSVSLIDYLATKGMERNQNACGNCYVWAGLGCLEILYNVMQEASGDKAVKLSVEWFDALMYGFIDKIDSGYPKNACCGGSLDVVSDIVSGLQDGKIIEYPNIMYVLDNSKNKNSAFSDGSITCGSGSCCNTTSPVYNLENIGYNDLAVFGGITPKKITEDVIEKMKQYLDQKKPIAFNIGLSSEASATLSNVYYADKDQIDELWVPYPGGDVNTCASEGSTGAHEMMITGYFDNGDEDESYWEVTNSWLAVNRADSTFRMKMYYDDEVQNTIIYGNSPFETCIGYVVLLMEPENNDPGPGICSDYPPWTPWKSYQGGDYVCYNNKAWYAKWDPTKGEAPGANKWGAWDQK